MVFPFCPQPYPPLPEGILCEGSMGCAVAMVQYALFSMGYSISINCIYGCEMKVIVESIQMKFPCIEVNGIYNSDLRESIQELLYKNYRIVQDPDNPLVLVNKFNSLPIYTPPGLTVPDVPFSFEEILPKRHLRRTASKALEELFKKAERDNIELAGVSGFRPYERQAEIFRSYYSRSPDEAVKFSARPGESEHQTGVAMDVSCPSVNYELEQVFGDTEEGKWLKDNAQDFGFIIRYPRDKENITGYCYEPWHIRYIGKHHAKRIKEMGLTLEEYLGRR